MKRKHIFKRVILLICMLLAISASANLIFSSHLLNHFTISMKKIYLKSQNEQRLWECAYYGNIPELQRLCKLGFDLNAIENGKTPLCWAVLNGQIGSVRILVEKGANIDKKDDNGLTPLAIASKRGDTTIVKFLIENGADIELADANGYTPLIWASREGHPETIKMLLGKGAKIETADFNGNTALMHSVRCGRYISCKTLIEMGADINAQNNIGQTALMLSSWNVEARITKLLIKNDADTEKTDIYGKKAFDYAKEKNRTGMKLILSKPHFAQNKERS